MIDEKKLREVSEQFYLKQAKHLRELFCGVPNEERQKIFDHFCEYNAESYRSKHFNEGRYVN